VSVDAVRAFWIAAGAARAGIGGAYLSLEANGRFVENISAGRGYLALAAVIFGRWHPLGAAAVEEIGGWGNAVRPPQSPVLLDYLFDLGRALRKAEEPGEGDGQRQPDGGANGLRLGQRAHLPAQGLKRRRDDHLGRVDQRPVQVEDRGLEHAATLIGGGGGLTGNRAKAR